MDAATIILAIVLPASAVLFAMYLVVKSFLTKEYEKRLIDIKLKNNELILPVRLQAYERLSLLLERISPNNLILRVNDPSYTSIQLQHQLLNEIRNEFSHNFSQQIYVSQDAWNLIKKAIDDLTLIINNAAQNTPPEAKSIELAKNIFEHYLSLETDSIAISLAYLKTEIQKIF